MLEVTQTLLCFWVNLVFVSSPTIIHKLSEAGSDSGMAKRNAGMFNFSFLGNIYLVLTKFSF